MRSVGRPDDRRRRRDGVRHTGDPGRHPRLLHPHPPRSAAQPTSSSPTSSTATTHSAGCPGSRPAPRRSAPVWPRRSNDAIPAASAWSSATATRPVHRGHRGAARPDRMRPVAPWNGSSASSSRRTSRASASASTADGSRPRPPSTGSRPSRSLTGTSCPSTPRSSPARSTMRSTRLGTPRASTKVVFTAHSLPERLLVDDPYPGQLRAGATAVAHQVGLNPWADWSIAWQSAGATDDVWRGPDIRAVLRDLAATGRADRDRGVPARVRRRPPRGRL